ncbi:UNVERIFIED_CONTAM: hypothetical protein RF648_22245, partial [Kocuria sp. CPCC 205274]
RVFSLDGTEEAVSIPNAADKTYVTSANPRDRLRCITVADYTFVVNKDVVVKEGTTKTDGGTFTGSDIYHDCLIRVVGGQYGRTIKVTINGHTASYVCPPGIVPSTFGKETVGTDSSGKPITGTVQTDDGSALAAQMPSWTDAQFIIDNPTQGTHALNGVNYPDQGLVPK